MNCPIIGIERLKSHTHLRRFLDYEVEHVNDSMEFLSKKVQIKHNNASIALQISKNNLCKKYNELVKAEQKKKEKAQLILNRSKIHDEKNILLKWNSSFEKAELDRDMEFIYNESIINGYISPRNLTKYSEYARLQLAFTDKNRPGAYGFSVADFVDKLPLWYPDDYTQFEALPDDWDPFDPREEEPSAWLIPLAG